MPAFIMMGKYSPESLKDISEQRNAEANEIIHKCGGRIVATYATMGSTDLLVIVDLPGVSEAFKASVALHRAFGISFSTVPALPIVEFDRLVTT